MKSFTCLISATLAMLLAAPCLSCHAQDDADPAYAVSLSQRERQLLEQMVCSKPYGVAVAQVDARSLQAHSSKADYATVKCQPHAQFKGQALYYVAQCAQEGKQWNCGRAEVETVVPLANRNLLVRPGTVELARAVTAIQKLGSYGYYQGQSLDTALQSTCYMGMGATPDLVEVSCRKWSIAMTFWCPQKSAKSDCPRVIYLTPHD